MGYFLGMILIFWLRSARRVFRLHALVPFVGRRQDQEPSDGWSPKKAGEDQKRSKVALFETEEQPEGQIIPAADAEVSA